MRPWQERGRGSARPFKNFCTVLGTAVSIPYMALKRNLREGS